LQSFNNGLYVNAGGTLTVNADQQLGNTAGTVYSKINMQGTNALLTGSATITFGGSASDYVGQTGAPQSFTIDPNITIVTKGGSIGYSTANFNTAITNKGTITVSAGTTTIDFGNQGTNQGTVQVQGGASANVDGGDSSNTFTNTGTISIT